MLKKRNSLIIFGLVLALLAGFMAFWGIQKVNAKYPWFWMYLSDAVGPSKAVVEGPKHILFLYVDHFEPHEQEAMDRWMKGYPEMASKHVDADGRPPQHSWFWFFSESDLAEKKSFLTQLSQLAYQGYGEIELHLHHGNDNEESFLKQMNEAITLSKQVGAMVTQETQPRQAFGFIHGMWGLDNSRGTGFCGVNNELILLQRLSCYADFTNPSWGPMHSKWVNRFYYATDNPSQPKSYDSGAEMEVGKLGVGDLFLFTGQSVIRFGSLTPHYDHGEIAFDELPTSKRIDSWIKKAVSIKGRPEWLFIKAFSHGAISGDHDVMLGDGANGLYSYLEKHYNDGTHYVLHYVTAREAYNMAKAAEAGETGNPNEFRNYIIPPYVNRTFIANVPFETISFDRGKAVVRFLAGQGSPVEVHLRGNQVEVSGDAEVISKTESGNETILDLTILGNGVAGFSYEA